MDIADTLTSSDRIGPIRSGKTRMGIFVFGDEGAALPEQQTMFFDMLRKRLPHMTETQCD
jgi:hypothetical protein